MSTPQKLTKKQKKSLAFRERKTTGKRPSSHNKNELDDMEANAVPAMEDQDVLGDDSAPAEDPGAAREKDGKKGRNEEGGEGKRKEGKGSGKGKGKAEAEAVPLSVAVLKGSKRKRGEGEEVAEGADGEEGRTKKIKRKKGAEDSEDKKQKQENSNQRFILFVGNLKYTTTKDAVQKHFAACDPPPKIRLLTPKAKPGATQKAKSKGCAFLEFTHRNALQQALKLHQSELEGRMINVELTAGGGGKSDTRLSKVRERNKTLLGQRVQKAEKEAEKDSSFPAQPQKPQRFSMTSGLEHKPIEMKTWTVGDVDDGQTHRGGERHRGKKSKSKGNSKAWGTGVNAIPVG